MSTSRRIRRATLALAVVGAAVAAAATTSTAAPAASCSFTLKIGDVLPFTGGLAAYGGNMDKAVKLAIGMQNAALKKAGLSKKIKVVLVDSQDGQTQAAASVEAAKKEVGEHVNVIIGEMASGATIPMAQSVTIPNHVVLISPTASAPQLVQLQGGNGYVWRAYPSDNLQGKVLAQAALQKFGKGATDQRRRAKRRIRHGARAALRRRMEEARRQGRRQHLLEPGPADVRHRGGTARLGQPGRIG